MRVFCHILFQRLPQGSSNESVFCVGYRALGVFARFQMIVGHQFVCCFDYLVTTLFGKGEVLHLFVVFEQFDG
jgi:hypothetical protein